MQDELRKLSVLVELRDRDRERESRVMSKVVTAGSKPL